MAKAKCYSKLTVVASLAKMQAQLCYVQGMDKLTL